MCVLVSVSHVAAHPDEHQHGVSIPISINLGKTFLRISRIRNIPLTWILARVFAYIYLLSFPSFWTLSIEQFWFWFLSILNGVTLKTSNTYKNSNLILKTTEWMIYKVLSLYYLHLFPPLAAVSLQGWLWKSFLFSLRLHVYVVDCWLFIHEKENWQRFPALCHRAGR